MQKQKIKIWKKIVLSLVGLTTAFTMTFASNFVVGRENVAYAIECVNSEGKAVEATTDGKCPTGSTEKPTAGKLSASEEEEINKMVTKFVVLEQWLNRLIWPVFMMIGGLINNELIFSNGMDDRLYQIWIQIRNLVNIIFVIVLVGIALYSVLGISSESSQYSIKTMLPKLIVGIIAVNFSFLGVKVILDATTVVTTAIFAIPDQTSGVLGNINIIDPKDKRTVAQLCQKLYSAKDATELKESVETISISTFAKNENILPSLKKGEKLEDLIKNNDKFAKAYKDFSPTFEKTAICMVDANKNMVLTQNGIDFLSKFRSNNAALAMAINMGGILFSDQQSQASVKKATTVTELAINIIFSFALNIVYLFAFFTLFLVLIARLVVVWISLAFSPVLALGLTVPGIADKVEMFKTLQTSFVKHITAPIVIAIAMTIGWIMLGAMNGMVTSASPSPGSLLDTAIPGLPLPGLETIQSLIVAICTAAVVWMGATSAAKGTLVDGAVNLVGDQLTRLGKFVAKAPFLYTPIVPIQITGEDGKPRNITPAELGGGVVKRFDQMETDRRVGYGKVSEILGGRPDFNSANDINSSMTKDSAIDIIKKMDPNSSTDLKTFKDKIVENKGSTWLRDTIGDTRISSQAKTLLKKVAEQGHTPNATELKTIQTALVALKTPGSDKKDSTQGTGTKKTTADGKSGKKPQAVVSKPAVDPIVSAAAGDAGIDENENPKNVAVIGVTKANALVAGITKQTPITPEKATAIATELNRGFLTPEAQKNAAESLVKSHLPEKEREAVKEAINKAIDDANKKPKESPSKETKAP